MILMTQPVIKSWDRLVWIIIFILTEVTPLLAAQWARLDWLFVPNFTTNGDWCIGVHSMHSLYSCWDTLFYVQFLWAEPQNLWREDKRYMTHRECTIFLYISSLFEINMHANMMDALALHCLEKFSMIHNVTVCPFISIPIIYEIWKVWSRLVLSLALVRIDLWAIKTAMLNVDIWQCCIPINVWSWRSIMFCHFHSGWEFSTFNQDSKHQTTLITSRND